jgi:hypothetical protein
MEDVAAAGDRAFPNKAHGMLPLLLPGALVARLAAGGSDAELAWALVLGRLLACSLPFAIAVLLLAGGPARPYPRGTTFAAVALALGSPLLAASLLAFSHALSPACCSRRFSCCRPRGVRPGAAAGVLLAGGDRRVPAAVPTLVIGDRPALLAARALRLALGGAPLGLSPATTPSASAVVHAVVGTRARGASAELAPAARSASGTPSRAGLASCSSPPPRAPRVDARPGARAWPPRHDRWLRLGSRPRSVGAGRAVRRHVRVREPHGWSPGATC